MIATLKSAARNLGFDTTRLYQRLSAASIEAAIHEQGLGALVTQLRTILPDVSDQYTTGFDRAEYERYWEPKMRGLHAFQVRCMLDALDHLGGSGRVLADIGDSSGNHALYLKAVAKPGQVERVVSVNLDPVAVDKVRSKGGDSVLCRAEEMDLEGIQPDLFLSFEMVEHLTDPLRFLHRLAEKGSSRYLLMTVPLVRRSRFGGFHMRMPEDQMPMGMSAEEVHIYEFSPADWLLCARFGGWKPVFSRNYLQYPRRHWLRPTQALWAQLDFEGFFAVLLERDMAVSSHYTGW